MISTGERISIETDDLGGAQIRPIRRLRDCAHCRS
mgnify:CR=1 FL=1